MTLEELKELKHPKCFYTKEETDAILKSISQKVVVEQLPENGNEGYLYLIPSITNPNKYEQYIWNNDNWEYLGLVGKDNYENYVTNPELDIALKTKLNKIRPAIDGMGYRVLDKDKSFSSQINDENTIYVIQNDFVLDNDFVMPDNCILQFEGGSINGAKLTLTNTWLEGKISFNNEIDGTTANEQAYMWWFNDNIDLWHSFINISRFAFTCASDSTILTLPNNIKMPVGVQMEMIAGRRFECTIDYANCFTFNCWD